MSKIRADVTNIIYLELLTQIYTRIYTQIYTRIVNWKTYMLCNFTWH